MTSSIIPFRNRGSGPPPSNRSTMSSMRRRRERIRSSTTRSRSRLVTTVDRSRTVRAGLVTGMAHRCVMSSGDSGSRRAGGWPRRDLRLGGRVTWMGGGATLVTRHR